jgi:platelet-activating factor acetylhydrolase IB subunit alpha
VDFGGPRGAILLASCSSDMSIKLWDPSDDYKNVRNLLGHEHSISAVRFIPSGAAGAPQSGNLLVSASRDKTLKIWDVTNGFCVKTLHGHTGWVRDVCPSLDGRFLFSTGEDTSGRLWDISLPTPEVKATMFGHDLLVECCSIAPPSTYQYLAPLAGLKKPPPATSTAEFMATGSRDKTIKIWDSRGTCIMTLIGHDNWLGDLVFHPGGKYLFSVADDRTLRCWDLSQEGRCVKNLSDAHERFITCIRWAPSVVKATQATDGASQNGTTNGTTGKGAGQEQIRCMIATGSVDWKLRIFAN